MSSHPVPAWRWTAVVFAAVVGAQLALVAAIGTDIPFYDQWEVEGRWFYPALREGRLHLADFFRAHNEHRIVWTHLLNAALFRANGGWDPLVQLVAGAGLRGAAAAALAGGFMARVAGRWRPVITIGVVVAFLPQLAWHNAVWGFQSQVYFVLLFSIVAFRFAAAEPRPARVTGAFLAGVAALLAMAPGAAVAIALLAVTAIRALQRRELQRADVLLGVAALVLGGIGVLLRAPAPGHATLHAHDLAELARTIGTVLAWPHVGQPLAAIVLNAPVVVAIATRLARRRAAAPGEDLALLLAMFSATLAIGAGWARGGSDEFMSGVPSRYVDLLVLLPLANVWCAVALGAWLAQRRRGLARVGVGAWAVFLLLGWVGLSAEMTRRIIVPRARDRDAPARLVRQFQLSGDPAVFQGQPRLLVPHPNLRVVQDVLADPRLRGALPPSLQPDEALGPLSRAARAVLFRTDRPQ